MNDSDVDSDELNVVSATKPANGEAAVNEDGTVTHTPDPDFHGTVPLNTQFLMAMMETPQLLLL